MSRRGQSCLAAPTNTSAQMDVEEPELHELYLWVRVQMQLFVKSLTACSSREHVSSSCSFIMEWCMAGCHVPPSNQPNTSGEQEAR